MAGAVTVDGVDAVTFDYWSTLVRVPSLADM